MNTLRLLGSGFWVLCGWFAGDFFCVQSQTHLEELDKTICLLHRIRQEISCRRTDLNLLFRTLMQEHVLDFLPESAGTFQTLTPPSSFSGQEAGCFQECFSGLGHLEAVQECDRLDLFLQRFADFRAAAEQTVQTRTALSRKLGLGAGLAAAILFF